MKLHVPPSNPHPGKHPPQELLKRENALHSSISVGWDGLGTTCMPIIGRQQGKMGQMHSGLA